MKMKNVKKFALLIVTSTLIAACQASPNSVQESKNSALNSSAPASSISSKNNSSSKDNKSSTPTSNKPSSSQNSKPSSSPSSKPASSTPASSKAQTYSFNDELNNDPKTCNDHDLTETIRKEATLLERGIKRYTCANCGGYTEQYYYKLDEFEFADTVYQYDGHERELLIKGVLPYGTTVKYENNKLTDVGETTATANIYDVNGVLLTSKTAKLSIIEKRGLANIRINTTDGEDPDWHTQSDGNREYKDMKVSIDNCDTAYVKTDVSGQVKVRGNSTNQESVGKRAFRIKLTGKSNFLGLNDGLKEKSWVLLADFFDQSKFRNESAFIMGDSLFNYSGYYSSDFQHVKLFMNGEDRGVYLLAEQQQAKKGRIPINEAADETVTGTDIGYLVEIDGLVQQQGKIDKTTGLGTLEGDPCFQSDSAGRVGNVNISAKPYVIKTDTFNDTQRLFIKKYINSCTKAFANICNNNLQIVDENGDLQDSPYSTQYETLNSFIDVDSFMRMYLLQEYLKDYDVGWGSFYMYVDFSANSGVKRLTMGAPWDFDLGVGDKQSGGMGGWGPWGGGQSSSSDKDIPSSGISSTKDDFLSSSEYTNGMTTFNPWLYMLSQTNFFKDMFKKYYSIFNNSQVYEKIMNQIAYERIIFNDDFVDNHTRYVTNINQSAFNMQTRRYDNFEDAADYLVRWLEERKDYLDSKYL